MRISGFFAAAAALSSVSVAQQVAPSAPNIAIIAPIAGNWSYGASGNISQAIFRDAAGRTQLTIYCTRASRSVAVAKPAGTASPFLSVWTTSMTRNVPASFDPAGARSTIVLAAADPLLDAIAYSRGRFAISASGAPPLVLPSWAEPVRVIEDCRN